MFTLHLSIHRKQQYQISLKWCTQHNFSFMRNKFIRKCSLPLSFSNLICTGNMSVITDCIGSHVSDLIRKSGGAYGSFLKKKYTLSL